MKNIQSRKGSILYSNNNGQWSKTRVWFDDKTKKPMTVNLRMTQFEKEHGYSKQIAKRLGIL